MAESMQIPDILYKLIIRFNNGEKIGYLTTELLTTDAISRDTRYAIVTSCSIQNPAECTDVTMLNLSDIAYIKSEKITLDELAAERRTAGLRSPASSDEHQPKAVSHVKFI